MPRRPLVRALIALVALSASACTTTVPGAPLAGPAAAEETTSGPTTTCAFTGNGDTPDKDVDPPSGRDVRADGTVRFTVDTDRGALEFEFDAASAPCSVHSFGSLAEQGFFDGTSCHRLTVSGLFVLQCGDATGTGRGSAGYKFDDPDAVPGEYARGVVAVANQGSPGTNGSQFFIVHRDSALDPDYPIMGRVTKGMDVIDEVAAAGVVPGSGLGEGDGKPVRPITLKSVEKE
ncbi:peptidylprolyl isomerase [Actinosynnema sp. NPDC023658]|uniref:peptidylprolyl isomerase n=1 Tax=Actinosynnema sp. NPDC023658 TaxID=3155465 RepID=UPI0033DF729E